MSDFLQTILPPPYSRNQVWVCTSEDLEWDSSVLNNDLVYLVRPIVDEECVRQYHALDQVWICRYFVNELPYTLYSQRIFNETTLDKSFSCLCPVRFKYLYDLLEKAENRYE